MAYIDTKYLGKCETCRHHSNSGCNTYCDHGEEYSPNLSKIPTADVVEVVRCKDCIHRNPCGHKCLRDNLWHNDDDFCSYGTPKERGADKPKTTCLNCKHLMFSDMYGECNKQLRIVNPSDTCEYAEPKEIGNG